MFVNTVMFERNSRKMGQTCSHGNVCESGNQCLRLNNNTIGHCYPNCDTAKDHEDIKYGNHRAIWGKRTHLGRFHHSQLEGNTEQDRAKSCRDKCNDRNDCTTWRYDHQLGNNPNGDKGWCWLYKGGYPSRRYNWHYRNKTANRKNATRCDPGNELVSSSDLAINFDVPNSGAEICRASFDIDSNSAYWYLDFNGSIVIKSGENQAIFLKCPMTDRDGIENANGESDFKENCYTSKGFFTRDQFENMFKNSSKEWREKLQNSEFHEGGQDGDVQELKDICGRDSNCGTFVTWDNN